MPDLRVATRSWLRTPGFAALAIGLVALATSLNATLFSLLYTAVLEPLPYRDAERLVIVGEVEEGRGFAPLTPANFDDLRTAARSFEEITSYQANELELSGVDPARRVQALYVLPSFFQFFGVAPLEGRALGEGDFWTAAKIEDGLWTVGDATVLSHGFWMRQFGGSSEILGSTIRLNDKSVRVVGVMPKRFDALWRDADLFVPWILPPRFWTARPPHVLFMIARLGPSTTLDGADSEVATVYARLASEYAETNAVLTARVERFRSNLFGDVSEALVILLAGALMVLLVTCSNLASLLVARASSRTKEIALRRALGASDARITRQLLTEGLVLAACGAAAGIALSYAALQWVALPDELPFTPQLSVPVLLFIAATLVATVLFLGLAPARLVSRTDLTRSLRGSDRLGDARASSTFVVVQVALALVLVTASALLFGSLGALKREALGFRKENVLTFYTNLPETRYPSPESRSAFIERTLGELGSIPGVISVATATHVPMTPMYVNLAVVIEGRPAPRGSFRSAPVFVSRNYLETMGISLSRGRLLDKRDSATSPWVIVVNERMAREFWPDEDAIGKRIQFDYPWLLDRTIEVVGVASDVKQEHVDGDVQPAFYMLQEQFPREWFYVAIRTRGSASAVTRASMERMRSLDPNLPVSDVKTMEERLSASMSAYEARAWLAGLYSSVGLMLALVGLYGMAATLAGRRTRELVIRIALGATSGDVTRLVMSSGAKALVFGAALGACLSWIGLRVIESLLFGIASTQAGPVLLTSALLLVAGLLALFVPAYRASRLEPAHHLRQDPS